MAVEIIQVDSFTDKPFSGNPAAVCILPKPADEAWMQDVAREMNLSETAFVVKRGNDYDLRWFTPAVEVDLCGHATLAAAHVLFEDRHVLPGEEARFHTRSGLLKTHLRAGWIEMDFPALPASGVMPPQYLAEALGAAPRYVGKSEQFYLVEVDSEEIVRKMQPNFNILSRVSNYGAIVTSRSASKEFDFVSRVFAPGVGIDEDPVTGSAHSVLGPYWAVQLKKEEFTAYQASARGGVVRVRVTGDRVIIGGQAVTVMRAKLTT